MTFKQQVTHLIDAGTPFDEIEAWIERTPLNDEEQSALWLGAWSLTDLKAVEGSAAPLVPIRVLPGVAHRGDRGRAVSGQKADATRTDRIGLV